MAHREGETLVPVSFPLPFRKVSLIYGLALREASITRRESNIPGGLGDPAQLLTALLGVLGTPCYGHFKCQRGLNENNRSYESAAARRILSRYSSQRFPSLPGSSFSLPEQGVPLSIRKAVCPTCVFRFLFLHIYRRCPGYKNRLPGSVSTRVPTCFRSGAAETCRHPSFNAFTVPARQGLKIHNTQLQDPTIWSVLVCYSDKWKAIK